MRAFLFFCGASLPAAVGRETPENLFDHSHGPALVSGGGSSMVLAALHLLI